MSFLTEPISLTALFNPKRKIANIDINVVISETTNDTLTITKQPVQQGASITDHSFLEPTTFSMTAYFQDSIFESLSETYKKLLKLQSDRVPFDIITPKRIYKSMLISALGQTTDKTTEHCLSIQATFQQVIIVKVSTTQVPRGQQKNPGGTGKTENAGRKQSALFTGKQAGQGFFQFLSGVFR